MSNLSKEERTAQILEMAKQGLTYDAIGEVFGITRQRVSQICLKAGVVRRPSDIKPEKWESHWAENVIDG